MYDFITTEILLFYLLLLKSSKDQLPLTKKLKQIDFGLGSEIGNDTEPKRKKSGSYLIEDQASEKNAS